MIRFLADASLHHAIVTGCRRREPTIEFLSANEAKLEGVPDLEVLYRAAARNRILVTSDFQTSSMNIRAQMRFALSIPSELGVRLMGSMSSYPTPAGL